MALAASIRCPACAAELPGSSRFCSSCGQAVVALSQVVTGMPAAGPALAVGVGRLISSDSIPVGGLTPGSLLADRYRIIGLLGRGGMGEVYRADDLKLGQPVALKFLPRSLSSDPVRRERFFAEVRITRQLAHPNICRVYDIAEVDGQHFLSMEYIDGEDLASLLTRIGHLSNEKALDIARQLLAGLAVAHERGVLHRDLKPANIMIDGRGRVRITDFGLAVAESDGAPAGDMSGTPAYMAPEQLEGKGSSVRSDIYALGLVLYEILSGKRAFTASSLAELRTEKAQSTPRAPSEIRTGIDPAVERLVMRCLDSDPRARPSSVAQLAAALPGGDPLAAAIAAGETPSPELVAASGAREGLRPAYAIGLFAFVVLGALGAIAMNERVMLYGRVNLTKSPDVLVERAQQFLKRIGYTAPAVDSARGFVFMSEFLVYMQSPERPLFTSDDMKELSPLLFWYRESPRSLGRTAFIRSLVPASNDPPIDVPGEAVVRFDGEGYLRSLEVVPPATDSTPPPTTAPDLTFLLPEAGFDASKWRPVAPQFTPHFYADTRVAWEGLLLNEPHRVEAGAYRGKPVYFAIVGGWSRERLSIPRGLGTRPRIAIALFISFLVMLVAGGLFFARRNLRLGRGDRRGAARLALSIMLLWGGSWLFSEHHVATAWEVVLGFMAAAQMLTIAGLLWVVYIALEPFGRRRWPHMLVSWTRVLSGKWGDPLVGRDLLIGCAAGVGLAWLNRMSVLTPAWFGYRLNNAEVTLLDSLHGTGWFVSALFDAGLVAIALSIAQLFFLFLLRALLRSEWAAALAFVFVSLAESLGNPTGAPMFVIAFGFLAYALMLFVFWRVGLCAIMTALFVNSVLRNFPMTLQPSVWYSSQGYVALAVVGALTLYAFKTSLGGQPILSKTGFDD